MAGENDDEIGFELGDGQETREGNPLSNLEAEKLFKQMTSVIPLRDVELAEDEGEDKDTDGKETIEDRIESHPKLTDIQSALKILFPKLKGYLNVIQMARISPDAYDALFWLLVKDLLEEFEDLSMAEAIAQVRTALDIPFDGEGRIEVVALQGRASEQEFEKERNKIGAV